MKKIRANIKMNFSQKFSSIEYNDTLTHMIKNSPARKFPSKEEREKFRNTIPVQNGGWLR